MKKRIFTLTIAMLFLCGCASQELEPFEHHYYEVGTLTLISNGIEYIPWTGWVHKGIWGTNGELLSAHGSYLSPKEDFEELQEIQCADGLEIVIDGEYTAGLPYYSLYNENYDLISLNDPKLTLPDEAGIYLLNINLTWICQQNRDDCEKCDGYEVSSYCFKIRV